MKACSLFCDMEVKTDGNVHWDLFHALYCMYCSFDISPPWCFMCIDRWVIGDLITSAYVPSAGEQIDRRQAGGNTEPYEKLLAVHCSVVIMTRLASLAAH